MIDIEIRHTEQRNVVYSRNYGTAYGGQYSPTLEGQYEWIVVDEKVGDDVELAKSIVTYENIESALKAAENFINIVSKSDKLSFLKDKKALIFSTLVAVAFFAAGFFVG